MSTDQQPDSSTVQKRPRGVYLLPNLFTTGALFAGFYAIISAMDGKFEAAAIAIFIAMILDGLDGRVARLTNTQSEFGVQYDSLADMVSFGLAPSLVVYQWALIDLGRLGWFAAFVYTAGTALRLARFNTRVGLDDKRYFQGLASPAAAAVIAGMVWIVGDYGIEGRSVAMSAMVVTIVVGLLMVSNFLYRSFKDLDLRGRVPFVVAVVVMLGFAIVFMHPALVLFLIAAGYALSGPVGTMMHWNRKRSNRSQSEGNDSEENSDS